MEEAVPYCREIAVKIAYVEVVAITGLGTLAGANVVSAEANTECQTGVIRKYLKGILYFILERWYTVYACLSTLYVEEGRYRG
ncbi:MAG: hypothetical protein H7843_03120 [Nitrospirota bacterium]